jgi:hypothetical protein
MEEHLGIRFVFDRRNGPEKPLNADSVLCWLQEAAGARNCGWRRTEKRKGEKK